MNISFEGKVALVTGTGFGLGVATAKAFAQSGASVVLSDSNEKEVQAAAKDFTDQGQRVLAVRCDVSDDGQVEEPVRVPGLRVVGVDEADDVLPEDDVDERAALLDERF